MKLPGAISITLIFRAGEARISEQVVWLRHLSLETPIPIGEGRVGHLTALIQSDVWKDRMSSPGGGLCTRPELQQNCIPAPGDP